MSERKLVEVEKDVFVYDPLDYLDIDFNDWSFVRKKKFDKVDKKRVTRLKYQGKMGKEKAKKERAECGSMDLRRWGYNA